MSAPIKHIPPRVVPVAPHLLDAIASICFEGTGYRAPRNPGLTIEDRTPVHIEPNAAHLTYDPDAWREAEYERNREKYRERNRETKRRTAARRRSESGVPVVGTRSTRIKATVLEEVFELVRIHGPVPAREACLRMSRCGYDKTVIMRALVHLSDSAKIKGTALRGRKGEPDVLVYEVAA